MCITMTVLTLTYETYYLVCMRYVNTLHPQALYLSISIHRLFNGLTSNPRTFCGILKEAEINDLWTRVDSYN